MQNFCHFVGSLVVVTAFFEVGGGRFEEIQNLVPFFVKQEGGVLNKYKIERLKVRRWTHRSVKT